MATKPHFLPATVTIKGALGLARPGDVLAFSGHAAFSKVIKMVTRSSVSHVAIIAAGGKPQPMITEATGQGVILSGMKDAVLNYPGEVWWLKLKRLVRKDVDIAKLVEFLSEHLGKPYDMPQAVKSSLDKIDALHGPLWNKEDFSAFFCSELVAGALEACGVVGSLNASETTPIDVCRFAVYDNYFQLKGKPRRIRGFNSVDPEGWGA